jgi:hypothetical protein
MALNLKDLHEEKTRLEQIIQHAQKELEAIDTLIAGVLLRSTESPKSLDSQSVVIDVSIQGKTVEAAVERIVKEFKTERHTAPSITAILKKRGYQSDNVNLQSNVSTALKSLFDKGVLNRKNIGGKRALYQYWLKQEGFFEKESQ